MPPVHPADAPPPAPPPPESPRFDWESLLGIRGAAWLGGITLVVAAIFFAKWSIDQGFFSPTIRIALMLVAGVAALVWAELQLRQGYQATANAVSAAGVVTLYAALVAGHSLYGLFPLGVAFVAMTVVTVAAAVIAVRFGALFTALLGLAGGLATPVLLSSGADRPLAFFAYLTVLAAGYLFVAERRGWASVTGLALAGTTLLQFLWQLADLTPATLPTAAVSCVAIAAACAWHMIRTRDAAGRSRTCRRRPAHSCRWASGCSWRRKARSRPAGR
ncbi:MAG: DUF2339 domain-containing protein [Vicinamibacterales bacterium]